MTDVLNRIFIKLADLQLRFWLPKARVRLRHCTGLEGASPLVFFCVA